jgi:hypothetical protein
LPTPYSLYLHNSFVSFFYHITLYVFTSSGGKDKICGDLISKCYDWVEGVNFLTFNKFYDLATPGTIPDNFIREFCKEYVSFLISSEFYEPLHRLNNNLRASLPNLQIELYNVEGLTLPSTRFW